jgi:hypothetical protein
VLYDVGRLYGYLESRGRPGVRNLA